jgi:hypothetical protein
METFLGKPVMKRSTLRRLACAVALVTAATAVTVLPAGPASADGFDLTGVERVSATISADTRERKIATVDCPGTKVVVGTGWSTGQSSDELLVEDLIPTRNDVTVVVRVGTDGYLDAGGNAVPWSLTVRAVCAHEPDGYTIIDPNSSATSLDQVQESTAHCLSAQRTLGMGFRQSDQDGYTMINAVVPGTSTVRVRASEDNSLTGAWNVAAIAICSFEIENLTMPASSNQTAYPDTAETASCSTLPTYYVAIGAGMEIFSGDRDVSVQSLKTFTYNEQDHATGVAVEDEDAEDDWDATTWAVCVPNVS